MRIRKITSSFCILIKCANIHVDKVWVTVHIAKTYVLVLTPISLKCLKALGGIGREKYLAHVPLASR